MRIHVVPGGPLLVDGLPVHVLRRTDDGYAMERLDDADAHVICRCGGSSSMPFCGKHPPYRCFEEEPREGVDPAPFRWDVPDPAGPPPAAVHTHGRIRAAGGGGGPPPDEGARGGGR